jgi:hypothetical protein
MAATLASIPPGVAYRALGAWGDTTPGWLGLPAHCPWPALPPESPWCTAYSCTDDITVVHSDDGLDYCYQSGPNTEWHCGSLAVIANTP